MTKKFWNDWKNRFGETDDIVIYKNRGTEYQYKWSLFDSRYDEIIDAEWSNYSVVLKIKKYDIRMGVWTCLGIFNIPLTKDDIYTIKFKKTHNRTCLP